MNSRGQIIWGYSLIIVSLLAIVAFILGAFGVFTPPTQIIPDTTLVTDINSEIWDANYNINETQVDVNFYSLIDAQKAFACQDTDEKVCDKNTFPCYCMSREYFDLIKKGFERWGDVNG